MEREKEELLREKLDEAIAKMVEMPANSESYFNVMDKIIVEFAQCINIEKMICGCEIPENALIPNGEKGSKVGYDSGNEYDEDNAIVIKYEFHSNGYIDFIYLPSKGKAFDEEEKQWLKKLSDMLYISGGRTRSFILCNKAMNYDLMTQLPNISLFFARIGKLIAMHQISNYTAFYFNCKNYKYINSVCGYNNGGEVLKIYSKKLYDFCTGDEIVARLGGDNFTALIKKERASEFLEMLKGTEITIDVKGEKKTVVISVVAGIYDIKNATNVGDVMMPIDFAFQAAKQVIHKDFVHYDGKVEKQIAERQRIVSIMQNSIENGEFVAFLQPKINMENGKIYGAEALVRWYHDGQLLSPATFIPAMERRGDICALDYEMLRQVCANLRKWIDAGKEVPIISVNFSRWHLKERDFVNKLEQIVDSYGVPHKYIEIELTETADVDGYNSMNSLFNTLKEKGFVTAIDDFGTGYSSLNMLLKSKVDIVKIDKAFVDEIENPEAGDERMLLKNIINIVSDLKKKIIAEGIETENQSKCLMNMGCKNAQGFFYYKPMEAKDFEKII